MDNEKHLKLIDILYKRKNWIKAGVLANNFAVSPRTIRTWISQINAKAPLVLSSNAGYKLNVPEYKKYIDKQKEQVIDYQTPEKRLYYVMNQLVINGEGINLFDLSDSLFISLPTLENDLKKAKSILSSFDLSLQRSGETVTLNGSEINKRKLITYVFHQECNTQMLYLNNIEDAFGYDLSEFKDEILEVFREHNLYVNEYTVGNILIHIMVTMQRIQEEHKINQESIDFLHEKKEYQTAETIAKLIEKRFDIVLNSYEIYNLAIMLIGKTTILRQDILNKQNLSEYIDQHEIVLVEEIIKKVNENFMISLNDDRFLVRFMLHVHNLIMRSRNKQQSKNPLARQIKSTHPLIYDLAVYISNYIQKAEAITINEDEIAYIAFHIAAFMEDKNVSDKKISCAIVCLDYYDIYKTMADKISRYYGALIDIQRIYTTIDIDYADIKAELVISTTELPVNINAEVVIVSPFLKEIELDLINKKVLEIKRKKEHLQIKAQLIQLFDPRLFHKNIYEADEIQMIKKIGSKMVEYEFIEESYIDDVIEREKMSSTVFNDNVAVPHSMHMNAIRSAISIVINDKPVEWGNQHAQIIALIAFNKKERDIFIDIFDHFIRIISEPENVEKLVYSKNYSDFIDTLVALIE